MSEPFPITNKYMTYWYWDNPRSKYGYEWHEGELKITVWPQGPYAEPGFIDMLEIKGLEEVPTTAEGVAELLGRIEAGEFPSREDFMSEPYS